MNTKNMQTNRQTNVPKIIISLTQVISIFTEYETRTGPGVFLDDVSFLQSSVKSSTGQTIRLYNNIHQSILMDILIFGHLMVCK